MQRDTLDIKAPVGRACEKISWLAGMLDMGLGCGVTHFFFALI